MTARLGLTSNPNEEKKQKHMKKREVKRVSNMDSELAKWQELLDAAEIVGKMVSDDERMKRLREAVRALSGED